MSHSRKKISCQQIPMMSATQKLRHGAVQALYKKRCCEKENLNESKDRKQSKCKEGNSSSKKIKRKKFLEQQVQKLLQRRYTNEQTKINQIKTQNANEFQGLKVDLKQMKDVLNKLSLQEKKNPKQEKVHNQKENKAEFSNICTSYERKIDDLRAQLEILKQTNAKLQEAHIQSQLFAKQTKDYCESINRQLAELGQKHLKCEQNAQQLVQKRQTIGVLQGQNQQLSEKLAKQQIQKINIQQQLVNLKSNLQNITSQNKKIEHNKIKAQKNSLILQQKLKEAQEKIKQNAVKYTTLESQFKEQLQHNQKYEQQIEQLNLKIEESHQQYEKSIQGLKQLILKEKTWFQQQTSKLKEQLQLSQKKVNELQKENQTYKNQIQNVEGQLATEKQRIVELVSKNELLVELKSKIQNEFKKIQTEFNTTKQDLGNTKQKLGSLSSMQKKCEELYLEIKLQKQRCNNFNVETAKERQALQNRVKQLQKDNEKYISDIQMLQSQKEELKQLLELQKVQSKKLFEDKIRITKQIKEFEQKISVMQLNKVQIIKQNENIMNKLVILRSEIEQKEKNWLKQKQRYQMKQLWLEKQKKQIENEVKGTLQGIKKRNDQIQNLNSSYEEEINTLKQQNTRLQDIIFKVNNQNENMKIALNAKQSKLNELQQTLNQNESVQKIVKEKLVQMESNSKNLNIEWQNRYSSLQYNYQKLQKQFKQNKKYHEIEVAQWKEKYRIKQKELNEKDGKIQNLSTIRESLQSKLQDIQERFHQTQTIRLSLSSQLQSQMQTRRNQEMLQEEKAILQNELKLKNKNISSLKQTIKMVRNESLQIREEVSEYNKLIDLEQLVGSQVRCIQQTLKYLMRQKDQLQLTVNILKSQNNELSNKIYAIENDDLQWPQRESRFKNTILHLQRLLEDVNGQKNKLMEQLNNQKEEIKRLTYTLEQQKSLTSVRIVESQTQINSTKMILEQQSQKYQRLCELLKERDNTIKQQAQKLKLNEEKRIKIINEVHSIQNQISQIGIKNSQLQEEKTELQQQLTKKQQQISLLSQKISILLQNNSALEVQKVAYNEQETLLRKEIKQWSQRFKMTNQSSQKKVDQIYEIYEARKNEAINVLKQKIKQLSTQLSNIMSKLNNKSKEIEALQQKYASLQKLFKENHELLEQQRKQRQRLMMAHNQSMIQIDNLKIMASSKERENQTLIRDKTILREKLLEQESKYQILRRKHEFLGQQRYNVQKEKENQNIELRVLKEENKNIEKVMNDQINQHKGIIEQLVVEKRMLYSQLNQQR